MTMEQNRPLISIFFISIFLCLLFSFFSQTAKASPARADKTFTFQNAALDAQVAIRDGKMKLLTFGEVMPKPVYDKETGLPVETIGCAPDEEAIRYIEVYNATIKKYLKDGKGPKH